MVSYEIAYLQEIYLIRKDLILMLVGINWRKMNGECLEAYINGDEYEKVEEGVIKVSSIEDLDKITFKDYEKYIKERYESQKKMSYKEYLELAYKEYSKLDCRIIKNKNFNKMLQEDYKEFIKSRCDILNNFTKNKDIIYDMFTQAKDILKKEIK